jgi:hypothetical protein
MRFGTAEFFGLCPLFCTLETVKQNVSETGSVAILLAVRIREYGQNIKQNFLKKSK